jgi:2',3'-cyclic-nucleotide 2'-phosphodiesterase (5'-nucleotidase family)
MAKTEVKKYWALVALALVLAGAAFAARVALTPREPEFIWHPVLMDGHRTGAVCVTQENVETALGTFGDEGYKAPNGVLYADESPVAEAAQALIEVQPRMAYLKEVIGHSARMMDNPRDNPDLPLANLVVDQLRAAGSKYFKVPMDFAITNFGGIRVPMPEGAITLDDIASMFPFLNYMCYVKMRGSELTRLLEQLSATEAFQAVSGAQVRVKAHKLESALIGGRPIDPKKVYNVTTIDFLLDGGDGLRIGAMAESVKLSRVLLKDIMLDYIRDCEAKGIVIDSVPDGRVIMED